eukprot:2632056-Pleurochrysis_carterae.AAC.3
MVTLGMKHRPPVRTRHSSMPRFPSCALAPNLAGVWRRHCAASAHATRKAAAPDAVRKSSL